MKKTVSFILALALVTGLLSGVSVFAADKVIYTPVTMDTLITEDPTGGKFPEGVSMPVSELFETGCIGSAESSGWLSYTWEGGYSDQAAKVKVEKNDSPVSYNPYWTLKDGVCIIHTNSSGWGIPAKYSPFYGNPYIKTVIFTDGFSTSNWGNFINKEICPNLETIIFNSWGVRGYSYGPVNIISLPRYGFNHETNRTPELLLSDGTYYQDTTTDGYPDRAKIIDDIVSNMHIVINSEGLDLLFNNKFESKSCNSKYRDLINWESFPTTPDMGITQPVIDTQTKLSGWARDRIEQAFRLDIAKDNWNGKDLTKPVTRAEFCVIAMEIYETVTRRTPDTSRKNDFTDVKSNAEAINGAYNMGIITGYDSQTFGPDNYISREQAATMLNRLANACGKAMPSGENPFTDAISSWALEGVTRCYAAGVMNGMGGKTFDANGLYTAEQSIVSNMRLYDYLTK